MLTETSRYKQGIESYNNFFEMLSNSIHCVLPGIKLGYNCGFSWRGFQIKSYGRLTDQRYYCQVYTDKPAVLLFQESYIDKASVDRYRYPFRYPLDLYKCNFFTEDMEFQKSLLVDYITLMEKVIFEWQESGLRKKSIPYKDLNSKLKKPNERHHIWKMEKIYSYIDSINQQNNILKEIRTSAENKLGEHSLSLNRQRTDSRSWWARVNVEKGYDFVWRIYYEKPLEIFFEAKNRQSVITPFSLEECNYFDLKESDQKRKLNEYIDCCVKEAKK